MLQPSDQGMLEEFMDESEPWLLVGVAKSDHFSRHDIRTQIPACHNAKVFMNAACDSIVLVVIGSTNILQDTHRGENQ